MRGPRSARLFISTRSSSKSEEQTNNWIRGLVGRRFAGGPHRPYDSVSSKCQRILVLLSFADIGNRLYRVLILWSCNNFPWSSWKCFRLSTILNKTMRYLFWASIPQTTRNAKTQLLDPTRISPVPNLIFGLCNSKVRKAKLRGRTGWWQICKQCKRILH